MAPDVDGLYEELVSFTHSFAVMERPGNDRAPVVRISYCREIKLTEAEIALLQTIEDQDTQLIQYLCDQHSLPYVQAEAVFMTIRSET